MKWNIVLGIILVLLFLSMLFTSGSEPFEFLGEHPWIKYNQDGSRTTFDDNLAIKFYSNRGIMDIEHNDNFNCCVPYVVRDSIVIMSNSWYDSTKFFFNDSTRLVVGVLIGEFDMKVYRYNETNELFYKDYIYLKRKLPYQY